MNLIIDQGNSLCKLALYEAGEAHELLSLKVPLGQNLAQAKPFLSKASQAIYSSVAASDERLLSELKKYLPKLLILDAHTPLPLEVNYERKSLGADRIAAAVGAYSLGKGKEILVIDAGTAITYERVSATGCYLGGNIAPGLSMRFKALHEFTGRLPLVSEAEDHAPIGNDSHSAIRSGVIRGLVFEIEGYINELLSRYPDASIYITGGNALFFASKLRNSPIVRSDLVLLGLNMILEYNE